jgi:hypothetical protein
MKTNTIILHNKTHLPILVEIWVKVMDGLYQTDDIRFEPYEEKSISSTSGGWNIHTMFPDKESQILWENFYIEKTSSKNHYPYIWELLNNIDNNCENSIFKIEQNNDHIILTIKV